MTKTIKRTLVLIVTLVAIIAFSIAVAPFSATRAKAESTNEAKIGNTEYATFEDAISAVNASVVVDAEIELLKDVELGVWPGSGNVGAHITSSVVINGHGHTISATSARAIRLFGKDTEAEKVSYTLKNLTIYNDYTKYAPTNAYADNRALETRGGYMDLTLDGVTLHTTAGNSQPFTVGGNHEGGYAIDVDIKNSEIICGNADAGYGYAITTFNKVNLDVINTKITAWAALNAREPSSSQGSAGSVFNFDGCEIKTINVHSGESNSYSTFVLCESNITLNVNDSKIDQEIKGDQDQYLIRFGDSSGTGTAPTNINTNITGNTVVTGAIEGKLVLDNYGEASNNLVITGGTFNVPVDEKYLGAGLAVDANGTVVDLSEYKASALVSLNNAKSSLLEANGYIAEKLAEIDALYATAKTAIESGTKTSDIDVAILSFVANAEKVEYIPLATVKDNAIAEIEEAYKKLLKDNNYTKENKAILKQYLDSAKDSIKNANGMSAIEGVKISFGIKTGLVKKDNLAWVWIVLPIALLVLAVSLAFLIRILPKKEKTKKERRAQVAPVTEKKKEVEMRVAPVVTEPVIEKAPVATETAVEETPAEEVANEVAEEVTVEETVETPAVEEPTVEETPAEEETVATVVEEATVEEKAEEPIVETPVVTETAPVEEKGEETVVVEEKAEEKVEETPAFDFASLASVKSKTFEEKLSEASEEAKAFYEEIKNGLLSYKKVKSRLSKKADSFRVGRKLIAKIAFAGKSVKCYLALNPDEIEKKFHHRSVSAKKAYASVPTLMRVKSKRAVKNTLTLIEKLATENGLIKK